MGFTNGECDFCGYPYKSSMIANIPCCCSKAQDEWLDKNTKTTQDGDQVCVLFGNNLQDGFAGFGDTRNDAIVNFIDEAEKHTELIKPPINFTTIC